jgi:hypothetical protein
MSKRAKQPVSIRKAVFGSPLLVAVAAMAIVVFGLSLVGYIRRGGFWSPKVEARVFDETARRVNGEGRDSQGQRMFPLQGEIYGEAERLREATAISLAATLCAGSRSMSGHPVSSVQELLSAVSADGAMPPGVEVREGGTKLGSQVGEYYVRYRPSPLGVEVVSLGTGKMRGRSFLIRLPVDGAADDGLTYYVFSRAEDVKVPGAFASMGEVVGAGWLPERFRATQVSAEDLAKAREWMDEAKGR